MNKKIIKLLFVDDDQIDRMAFSRFVKTEKIPFEYVLAESVAEADGILSKEKFDVVITDYNLGDGTALDLFKYINDAPFIVVTGLGDQDVAVRAMKDGASDFVTKDPRGKHLPTLPITIENALKRKDAEEELTTYREHLEELVQVRTRELQQEISVRKEAENEVRKLNSELEERVADRTVQLQDALRELKHENEERARVQVELSVSNKELTNLNETIATESYKLQKLNDQLLDSEYQLREANAAKDKFFNIIAHDLKNPMQLLLFSADLLTLYMKKGDKDKMKKYMDSLNQTIISFRALLENLLTWARTQRGGIEFRPKETHIRDMFEELEELCLATATKKEIDIINEVYDNVVAHIDLNMFSTVIRNLAFNAMKFTEKSGSISFTSEDKGNVFEFSITDTGTGIKKDDIGKLFRIDVHHTTIGTSKEKGTGLGLIICKEFIEQHGGNIWVESEYGHGASFKFTIPKDLEIAK